MKKSDKKTIFITWTTYSPHSYLLNEAFNSKIFYIKNLINSRGLIWNIFFLLDYLYKSIKTAGIMIKNKADLVIMQNPPSITPVVVLFVSLFYKCKTIVDSHNGAFEKRWESIPFYKWALKKADIVTVHNEQLFSKLTQTEAYKGVNFRILNSRLTDFSEVEKEPKSPQPYFLVVSAFANDEPMDIILEGLKLFNKKNTHDVKFKLTGNYNKKSDLYEEYKTEKNIEFMGFVSNEDYRRLFINSFGIISISTRDDVQQFALMEALGAKIPFISNKNVTNEALFDYKQVLVEITPEKLVEGIEEFIRNKEMYDRNILELNKTISLKWEKDFSLIKSEIGI